MQLREIFIENLNIPFNVSFQHSSAIRTETEAVLVTAITEDGTQGIGEGCPRKYVTGETLKTTHLFFNTHRNSFLNIHSLDDLKSWIDSHQESIDRHPAAFCAVELAILNALAKDRKQSVEELLFLPELSGNFHYTAVLGASKLKVFQAQLQQYIHLGFSDYKVKVFGEPEIDQKNIQAIKECGVRNIRLRLDANNLWSTADEAINYIKRIDYPIFALEEPLGVHQYADCIKVFEALNAKIILDESFIRESDFDAIQPYPDAWIINVRISKMGGILRSLKIVNKARSYGVAVIIGAQVGETSILTRAALTVASTCRDILIAQEGAFGTYLLERDITEPSIRFGKDGRVDANQL